MDGWMDVHHRDVFLLFKINHHDTSLPSGFTSHSSVRLSHSKFVKLLVADGTHSQTSHNYTLIHLIFYLMVRR